MGFSDFVWVTLGSPPPSATQQIGPFASEELCYKALDAIKTELNTPMPGERIQTFARLGCFALKDKDAQKDSPRSNVNAPEL
jgi:hypothetical protein